MMTDESAWQLPSQHQEPRLSLRQMMDDAPHTALQKEVMLLSIAAVVLDGFDNQLLGFAIPALLIEWGVERSSFVPVIALSLIAMSIGTAIGGWLGDRHGRRPILISSIILFAIATLLTLMATGVLQFTGFRILAALGMGGAMPNAVALLSEFTPRRRRSFAITFGMICLPLGGVLAGLVSAGLLPLYGWRSIFLVGGLMPLLFSLLLSRRLPESPEYLLNRRDRRDDPQRLVARLGYDEVDLAPPSEQPGQDRVGVSALFRFGYLGDTLLIWLAFLCTLTAAYCVFNWVPTLSARIGFDLALSSSGLAAFNFGGIVGAILAALRIDRSGSRLLTPCMALGGVLAAFFTGAMLGSGATTQQAIAMLFVSGFFIAGLQPMLFALAANIYPDRLRATGVRAALAVGRLGAVTSSALGGALIMLGPFSYSAF